MANKNFPNADVTRIRSSSASADEIAVVHVIKNGVSTLVNKEGFLFLFKGMLTVDDTRRHVLQKGFSTHLGSGRVGTLAQHDNLPSRESLLVVTASTTNANVLTRPFKLCVWVLDRVPTSLCDAGLSQCRRKCHP